MTDTEPVVPAGEDDGSGVTAPADPPANAGPSAEDRDRAAELILGHTPLLSRNDQIDGTLSAIDALARYLSEGTLPDDRSDS